jgi:homospermidine synthase
VAIAVVAAVIWMLEHPACGLCLPEDLPHEYILGIAKPFLGKFISTPSDWTPLQGYTNEFAGYIDVALDMTDPWQFKNFLVRDRD